MSLSELLLYALNYFCDAMYMHHFTCGLASLFSNFPSPVLILPTIIFILVLKSAS